MARMENHWPLSKTAMRLYVSTFALTDAGTSTEVLTQSDMPDHFMKKLNLHYTTMTDYDKTSMG